MLRHIYCGFVTLRPGLFKIIHIKTLNPLSILTATFFGTKNVPPVVCPLILQKLRKREKQCRC